MLRDAIDQELSALAFEYFYWFSRFEFALKENGYLTSHAPGARADPGWNEFIARWSPNYVLCGHGAALLAAAPKRQIVGVGNALEWQDVAFLDFDSDLAKAVRLLRAVRNNLFHGGKHGEEGWDQPDRGVALTILARYRQLRRGGISKRAILPQR